MVLLLVKRKQISLTDKIGKQIYERVMARDSALGGIVLETLGVQGSGKTSLLLSIAEQIMSTYPKELIFWRDSFYTQCQFNRVEKWQIYIEKGVEIEFRDIDLGKTVSLPVTFFDDFDELISLAKPQQLNVIYFENNIKYVDFIKYLRLHPGFQSLFIDEYEDIAPLRCRGEQWKKNEEFSQEMKHIRRGLVNLFCDTQNSSDVDWRVRSKIMCHVYLYGSKVDHLSPVDQAGVNALDVGEILIDYGHALFGKGSFNAYPPRKPILECYNINNGY